MNQHSEASLSVLRARAQMYQRIRSFFDARNVLAVETPILYPHGVSEPHIESFSLPLADRLFYLQTSPEYAMKRLLADHNCAIYQIAKVFRAGEASRRHNPEFTMLEWYQPGFDLRALIDESCDLLRHVFAQHNPQLSAELISYQAAFKRVLDVDVFQCSVDQLAQAAAQQGVCLADTQMSRDDWLHLLMSECIEPSLDPNVLTVVHGFPASQAALAEISQDNAQIALRCEIFYAGMELANGYQECCDAQELRQRFMADNRIRAERGLAEIALDEAFLAAVADMPACAGMAIGLDRLLMIEQQLPSIKAALSLPFAGFAQD